MTQHILIIGGGLGGLFTGAFLAKEGYQITVLEKNQIIGGGLQCFTRKGETYETGMHILGGFQPGGNLNKICRYLGILDKLAIRPTDDDAIDSITITPENRTFCIPRGHQNFLEYFATQFPEERQNLQDYMQAMYRLCDEVDLYHLRKSQSIMVEHSDEFTLPADQFIAKYIHTPLLQKVLAYMNTMYGGMADYTPAYIHALINVLYIEGSSQFEGGSQQLADALQEVITTHGGQVLAGDAVTRIEVANRMVQSVSTAKGHTYTADHYISAIHPCAMLSLTGPDAFPKAYRTRLEEITNSYSSFTVYIQFKPGTQPYVNHPRYFLDSDIDLWNLHKYDTQTWPAGFMTLTPPAQNQGPWASRMIINCIMPFEAVSQWTDTTVGRRGTDYEQWKQERMQTVINKLEQSIPGIKNNIQYCFAATPLTIRDYYATKDGAIYGYMRDAHNIMHSQVPIATKVRNLYLTGQNVNLHGICGVPLTAIEVTEAFIGRGNLIDKINQA